MYRTLRLAAVFAAALALATTGILARGALAQEPPAGTMVYKINHSEHGDIGTHAVTFSRSGDQDLMVDVKIEMKVKILFITAFRFESRRSELWRDGQLVSYRAETDDDGTEYKVRAEAKGDLLEIDNGKNRTTVPLGTFPTHPWNIGILDKTTLIDTKTGEIKTVAVEDMGEETIEAAGGPVAARKYRVTGDMERELWFGPEGRWLQLRFDKDGAKVTFTLL